MLTIRAFIWDLAGVLLHTIRGDFNSMMAERLQAPLADVERVMDSPENTLWDMAELNDDEFFSFVVGELNLPEEKKAVLHRFVIDDFYIDQELLAFVRLIRNDYASALLTNFPAHLHKFMRTAWHIQDAFDLIIASCDVKLIKPDPRIYQLTLDQLGVTAQEAVFIDDRVINVDAAELMGMQAILFKNRQQVMDDILLLLHAGSSAVG